MDIGIQENDREKISDGLAHLLAEGRLPSGWVELKLGT